MMYYKRKPVVIEATQLTGPLTITGTGVGGEAGDWLIMSEKGELQLCKDDVFRETYELADEYEAPTRFGGQAKPRRGRRKKAEVVVNGEGQHEDVQGLSGS